MADSQFSRKLTSIGKGVQIPSCSWTPLAKEVLSEKAIEFVAGLHRQFENERINLLSERKVRQSKFDAGELPKYLDRKSEAAAGTWKVSPIPADLLCRRVEITGPVNSAKMVINMLSRNSEGVRADCAMLDFEDSMKPVWQDVLQGVKNVSAAAEGSLEFMDPESKKHYRLNPDDMPVIMIRCRGLHLLESNFLVDGRPISGGLLELALSFFHTGPLLVSQRKTPKFYIPKCEHYLEARWWNKVFTAMEEGLGLPVPTLRATFLVETLPAAFQMEEILYEFRQHAAGLNGGRWDKIFSDIKTLKFHADRIMADRASINMSSPWMARYAERIVKICHARGAFAMGGMSAFTPGRTPEIREEQTAKVIADKAHEAEIGHDGCWVSHPYFIDKAMQAFKQKNQLAVPGPLADKYPELLPEESWPRTLGGLRTNVRVAIAYMHGWLSGLGCISWDNLMEDLATLEISRAQVWQWFHHKVKLDDGTLVDSSLVEKTFAEELAKIKKELALKDTALWETAKRNSQALFLQENFPEFFSFASDEQE